MVSIAQRLRPASPPGAPPSAGATSCCATCASRAPHRAPSTGRRSSRRCRRKTTSSPPPRGRRSTPYFTTWIAQQVVDRFGAGEAFGGGLQIRTTLDPTSSRRPEQAISQRLTGVGPVGVAGRDRQPHRRGARDGRRHATTAATRSTSPPRASASPARRSSRSCSRRRSRRASRPTRCGRRRKRDFTVPGTHGHEHFVVNNYEDSYAGSPRSPRRPPTPTTPCSPQVGIKVGTRRIARLARPHGHPHAGLAQLRDHARRPQAAASPRWTWRTPTRRFAHHGERVTGSLGAPGRRPRRHPRGRRPRRRRKVHERRSEHQAGAARDIADETTPSLMSRSCATAPGARRAIPGVRRGQDRHDRELRRRLVRGLQRPLHGRRLGRLPGPPEADADRVRGSRSRAAPTRPLIWHDFMIAALNIDKARAAERAAKEGRDTLDDHRRPTVRCALPGRSSARPRPAPAPNGGQAGPTDATDRKQDEDQDDARDTGSDGAAHAERRRTAQPLPRAQRARAAARRPPARRAGGHGAPAPGG